MAAVLTGSRPAEADAVPGIGRAFLATGRRPSTGSPADSSELRILGLSLDRLTLKLAVGVALLVIVPLAAGLYVLSRRQYDRAIETRQRAAELQNRILETALRHEMMDNDPVLLSRILDEIGSQPEVRRAMIFDHEGEIRISSERARVGERIPRESATCRVCHDRRPEERKRWVLLDEEPDGVLRSVLPIENRTECQVCHPADQRLIGMLVLDVSLSESKSALRRDLGWIGVWAGTLALLLLAGVGLLVRHLILRRLARLGHAARTIAAGNLDERAEAGGRDVIASVARDFNEMARGISGLVSELRDQEGQLTSVMDSLDDGLVVLDRESRVVACNRSFCRRLDAQPHELKGQTCREAVHGGLPCCQGEGECPASRCAASGRVERGVYEVRAGNGEVGRVEEVCASPVLDEHGAVVQVVELWRDITERVKEEQRLAEIERLVSLGVLASGFSHEVNTPLASMLTSAEAVIGRIDDSRGAGGGDDLLPAIRGHADTIREQVLRCRGITDQFLRFSRGIPPSLEPLDLGRTVAEVVNLVRPTAREARVELRVEGNGTLPAVRANAEVVQHVILNLLVNSLQSCGDRGGSVVVSFDVGSTVRIGIRDSGCGIALEDRRHLFEPFRSRKPQGTGLGLFLSRTFMRRFGGDVRLVDSEAGVGSHFEVVFARADGDQG